jgi:hypothetical protein
MSNRSKQRPVDIPIMPEMCGTCPFRDGSKYEFLRADLTQSALTEASRICHCTGTSGIMGRTGKPERLCRGARNVQLNLFFRMGFIESPTDEAWRKRCVELGLVESQK